jgi:hypothetical protein
MESICKPNRPVSLVAKDEGGKRFGAMPGERLTTPLKDIVEALVWARFSPHMTDPKGQCLYSTGLTGGSLCHPVQNLLCVLAVK